MVGDTVCNKDPAAVAAAAAAAAAGAASVTSVTTRDGRKANPERQDFLDILCIRTDTTGKFTSIQFDQGLFALLGPNSDLNFHLCGQHNPDSSRGWSLKDYRDTEPDISSGGTCSEDFTYTER